MSPVVVIILVAFVAGILVLVGARASRLARELQLAAGQRALLEGEARALSAGLVAAEEKNTQKIGWLDNQEQEITWLRAELEKRPKIVRKTYKILTLGMKATGKTSLTLKWANPLTDLGTLEGTKIERYERTVSHVPQKDLVTEHVFEVHDWGGEHLVDAQHELIVEEIHGLLIVVDLGGKDAKQVEPARIHDQHQEFLPQVLKYIFGPKTVALCKTVVLFINKSDLLSGTPAQVEAQARQLYAPLVENLNKYSNQLDVRVLVGSASYGHSTHLLFSHFVEQILPKNAYDNQLLQRMKSDCAATPATAQAAPTPAVSVPVAAPGTATATSPAPPPLPLPFPLPVPPPLPRVQAPRAAAPRAAVHAEAQTTSTTGEPGGASVDRPAQWLNGKR